MSVLQSTIRAVEPLDAKAARAARARQAALTKPAGSLGTIERLHAQLAGIRRDPLPLVERPAIVVMAADHGVADEGVSAYPRRVTAEMVCNFARGGAAINVLARDAGARLVVADFGVDWPASARPRGVLDCSLGRGTHNLAVRPAMARGLARRGLELGIRVAHAEIDRGADLLALGEMGIGNTTAAAALIAALTGRPADVVTGFGTGVDGAGWQRKVGIVEQALRRAGAGADDPLGALAELGGFEIGGLAGAMLGAAARRCPILLDGVIVAAAALVAVALCPAVRPYLVASHRSAEPGHRVALEFLELEPLMDLGMRLGEASGAALALGVIRTACRLPREMATFVEAGVSRKTPAEGVEARAVAEPPGGAMDNTPSETETADARAGGMAEAPEARATSRRGRPRG